MTMNQDEAIARSCGCGEFDDPIADAYWELTPAERIAIDMREIEMAEFAANMLDAATNPDSEWVICGGALVRKGNAPVYHNGDCVWMPSDEGRIF